MEIVPDHSDAKRHLSEVHVRLGNEHVQNRQQFESAHRLSPGDALPLLSLASSQADQDKFEQAEANFAQAAALPNGKAIWNFKRLGFCPSVFETADAIDDFWANHLSELDKAIAAPPEMVWNFLAQDGCTPSFNLPHLNRCCREVKEKFAAFFRNAFPQTKPERRKTDRPRIGFVVTEGHESGFKRVMDGVIEHIDRERFEVKLFCCSRHSHLFKEPVLLSHRLDVAAETIRHEQCDLLYHWKVGGGPLDYFLPFAQCAPVQCTGYGTHGTSGVGEIDFYLSSSMIESPDADAHYTEQLYRMSSFPTYHQKFERPDDVKRTEFPVPETSIFVLCGFRNIIPCLTTILKRFCCVIPAEHC